ncbi:CRISPR-associated protein Cas5, partial [Thiolapillus sp.]
MDDYLVFQLYAPLASWGGQAVGQERPSDDHPGRSALLGLLAAALGIRREEEA